MVDKEGTVKVDVDVKEDTEDSEKENARKMRKRITDLRFDIADIEANIGELRHLDNGDLTDQIGTMMKYSAGLYKVLSRAMKIVPVYEGILEDDYRDGHDINLLKAVAKQMAEDARNNDYTAIDDLFKNVSEAEMRGFISEMESIEEAVGARQISQIKKKYDELEDQNDHGGAALLLVNAFGDKEELDIINAINARHKKRGNIMPAERTLRDAIAQNYYKNLMQNEGVISDLFKSTTDEKRQTRRMGSAYDAAMLDKHTKKFEKQGLSAEDARKYAYRKVHGKPLDEVAGPEKCWDGYKKVGTKPGTGKNKGKRVNDCEKA